MFRAARGRSNARIAVEVGVHVDTARTWRGRLADLGLPGLTDRERQGRPAAVALVVPGAGPRGRRAWHRALPLGVHRVPPARPGRAQALTAPLVDLPHRPGLPAQGRARTGPVCPRLGRHPARRGRVRDQRDRTAR
ncbi:helix-turn-helix domain-containing protein [Streptomyces prunicolor]|nr:helix-turn-helix domain-containing protein [Streptomyces prunicolor]MCX5238827.1 helix-turn-helix domain-containing protein [Streptomyces prunicolor]